MQPGVIMNRDELRVALMLLGKRELSDVIGVPEEFRPTDEVMREMALKHFFELDEKGDPGWNNFVHMVLWTAANAESELRFDSLRGSSCRLFFQGDTVILLTFDQTDGYVFYFLGVIPQVIGGLTNTLSWLEKDLDSPTEIKGKGSTETLLVVRGWEFGSPFVTAQLVRTTDGIVFTWSTADGDAGSEILGFYPLIQKMTPWIVDAHRRSILAKGEIDDA